MSISMTETLNTSKLVLLASKQNTMLMIKYKILWDAKWRGW